MVQSPAENASRFEALVIHLVALALLGLQFFFPAKVVTGTLAEDPIPAVLSVMLATVVALIVWSVVTSVRHLTRARNNPDLAVIFMFVAEVLAVMFAL